MAGFLYKKLTEKERGEIKKESEKIINSFGKKLSEIKKLPGESFIERKNLFREEGPGSLGNEELKKRILNNAPEKNKEFIIAEKKGWE